MSALLTIEQLNKENTNNFIHAINVLFETAPPLANRLLAARPYRSYSQLIDYAETICRSSELEHEDKLQIINAHPRIGASQTELSALSLKEQGYHDAHQAISSEDARINHELSVLNDQYEDKYGFKFIIFVNGRPRRDIIPIIKERIANDDPEKEYLIGVTNMIMIAKDRLRKLTESKI